jgi:hypothetical protein
MTHTHSEEPPQHVSLWYGTCVMTLPALTGDSRGTRSPHARQWCSLKVHPRALEPGMGLSHAFQPPPAAAQACKSALGMRLLLHSRRD